LLACRQQQVLRTALVIPGRNAPSPVSVTPPSWERSINSSNQASSPATPKLPAGHPRRPGGRSSTGSAIEAAAPPTSFSCMAKTVSATSLLGVNGRPR
jgi:hypothetical protein